MRGPESGVAAFINFSLGPVFQQTNSQPTQEIAVDRARARTMADAQFMVRGMEDRERP